MRTSLLTLLGLLLAANSAPGQGVVRILPVPVVGYAREFPIPVHDGSYVGALYGAISNSPAPPLLPLYYPAGAPVVGGYLTFPNSITLAFPAGTTMILQVECWSPLNPLSPHYATSSMVVVLGGAPVPAIEFGTLIVPLVPEPAPVFLAVLGGGALLLIRQRRRP